MDYHISLQTMGFLIGGLLIAMHLFGLLNPAKAGDLSLNFPRSKTMGIALLTIALAWTLWLAARMDWGEFYRVRPFALVLLPISYVLLIQLLDEFLAVRALGVLLLLLAAPMLDSAFLKPEPTRLFLVILAYIRVLIGLLWVGMPFLMRDFIDWARRSPGRFRMLSAGGVIYGLILLICAFTSYRGV